MPNVGAGDGIRTKQENSMQQEREDAGTAQDPRADAPTTTERVPAESGTEQPDEKKNEAGSDEKEAA